jgi:hypothetical protein
MQCVRKIQVKRDEVKERRKTAGESKNAGKEKSSCSQFLQLNIFSLSFPFYPGR